MSTMNDLPNGLSPYPEVLGYSDHRLPRLVARPDLQDLVVGELGHSVPITERLAGPQPSWLASAVFYCVCVVGLLGVPPEVAEAAVSRVRIGVMATLHPQGAWTNEGLKHQPMDEEPFVPGLKHHTKMPICDVRHGLKLFPVSADPHSGSSPPPQPNAMPASPDIARVINAVCGESKEVQTAEFDHENAP